jgi:hypothetical protein
MGPVIKKQTTRPLPAGIEFFVRKESVAFAGKTATTAFVATLTALAVDSLAAPDTKTCL